MTSPAIAIANYFIKKANERGESISNLKVQKLLYFAQGWKLAFSGTPLFRDRIEAWRLGPVVPDVYHVFKVFGKNSIPTSPNHFPVEEQDIPLLDEIYRVYGHISAEGLVKLAHDPGTPWKTIYEEDIPNVISDTLTQSYFVDLNQKANEQE